MKKRGSVRDAILDYLKDHPNGASVSAIRAAVNARLGDVPASSVRSYLNLNVSTLFDRSGPAHYRLSKAGDPKKRIRASMT